MSGNLDVLDAIPDSVGEAWVRPELDIDDIAYLQYTSGSTRTPAGVEPPGDLLRTLEDTGMKTRAAIDEGPSSTRTARMTDHGGVTLEPGTPAAPVDVLVIGAGQAGLSA